MKGTVFLSCGDVSGDRWASHIVRLLLERFPGVSIVALGGGESEKSGARLLADTVSCSLVGLSEVFQAFSFWKEVWDLSRAFLEKERPSVVIAIDNPGFNLRLTRYCAQRGIPVVYFAPPQVWAWGRWRGKFLASLADVVLYFFPWEGSTLQEVRPGPSGLDILCGCSWRVRFLRGIPIPRSFSFFLEVEEMRL